MKILFATSEAAPFAKTGGLADVCGALPSALARQGHEVSLVMPAYRSALRSSMPIESTGIRFDIPIGSKLVAAEILRSTLPGGVPVYLVGQQGYYDRPELYRERGADYADNCERYVFFCRAALECVRLLSLYPDVIHCHDWQTGLIPAYLKLEYFRTSGYERIGSLMTIHNMAYQGVFWHWDMLLTGIDWQHFNWHEMEFYGQLNLLKTGLVYADRLNTVSPQYAREIQQHPHGCGLEGVLQHRSADLSGIVNGVDTEIWNPGQDQHLAQRFTVENWQEGKAACKEALQRELGLPVSPRTPLIGIIGRLATQKGWDLLAELIRQWSNSEDLQWAILGTGDPEYMSLLGELSRARPDRVAARAEFSDPLAHRIEAGCDLFLMPSQYEPCGLNQLYSLRYGTVPVVHATGGLVDTITDADERSIQEGRATGFRFDSYGLQPLQLATRRALEIYHHRPEEWRRIVEAGMRQDWSWDRSAARYAEVYSSIRR